ncbi:MAG: hypothetical protein WA991_10550 [Ornithinimicrobium sp.]
MSETPHVAWSSDVGQADWIRERLSPFDSGVVTSVVPGGFEAYARILHPARDDAGRLLGWDEVAQRRGVEMRHNAQFHQIALGPGPADPDVPILIHGPEEGSLDPGYASALCQLLRHYTPEPDDCWFALWTGYGWEPGARAVLTFDDGGADECLTDNDLGGVDGGADDDAREPVPPEVRDGPVIHLPSREYFLYRGPVEQALAFVDSEEQTANLWWPLDRSWCVAT